MKIWDKSKQFVYSPKVQFTLRVVVGLLFVVAGVAKMFDTMGFARIIGNYHLVPSSWVMPLAILIPYLELAIGLMILLDFYRRLAIIVGSILIIIFTTVSMYMYLKTGVASDCGCYGKLIIRKNNLALLIENSLILVALILNRKPSPKK